MTTKGIDLSLWDAGVNRDIPLDWSKYSWDFAFIKVSEGKVIDPAFDMQWSAARGNTIRGAYHYFRCFVDPKQSVLATLDFLNNDYGELPLAFDLEGRDGFPASYVMQQSKSWLSWYEEFTGIRPIIYSRRLFLRDELKTANYDWLKNYKLWLAEYYFDRMSPVTSRNQRLSDVLSGVYPASFPVPPAPFSRVSFFQFSEFGQPENIPGYYLGYGHKLQVDLNLYNGTQIQMLEEFKMIEPPQTGDSMTTYNLIATGDPTKVFADAGGTSPISQIAKDTQFTSRAKLATTYYITSPKVGYVKISQVRLVSTVPDVPPPPPDDPPPIPVVSPVIFASMDFDLPAKRMTTTRRRADGTSDISNDPIA